MGLLAEYEVASDDCPLGPTMETLPDAEFDVENVYARDPDRAIGFCWIECGDRERLEAALGDDRTVASFERIDASGDAGLYRIVVQSSAVGGTYLEWIGLGGQLIDCRGTAGRWQLSMRFPDRERFGTFHESLVDAGVDIQLRRLSDGVTPERGDEDPLTPRQREALEIAYESGFFDVPRRTTLSDLAAELDISDQAVSERLRRGQSRLIDEFVL